MDMMKKRNLGATFLGVYIIFTPICYILGFALGGIREGAYFFLFTLLPTLPWPFIVEPFLPEPWPYYTYLNIAYFIVNAVLAYFIGTLMQKKSSDNVQPAGPS